MPIASRDLVRVRACDLGAEFLEGSVACVQGSLLEELHVVLFLSSLNFFLRQLCFVDNRVDELIEY